MSAHQISRMDSVLSLSRNAGFLILSRVLEKGIRLFYIIILARWLGPEILGLYNYGIAWYLLFLPLAYWGIGSLLSVHLGRRQENAEDIVGALFLLRTVMTLAAALSCLVIGLLSHQDALTRHIISLFVIALAARSLAQWGRSCFVALEQSRYSAGLEVGFRMVEALFGILYLSTGGGLTGICAIHAIGWILEAALALVLVHRRLGFKKFHVPWRFASPYAREAFPVAVNVFLFLAMFQAGFIVLKHMLSEPISLGLYTVAFQMVFNTSLIPQAFGKAALPILSREYSRGSGQDIVIFQMTLKIFAFFSALLVMVVILYGDALLRMLFGSEYLPASGALVIIAAAMIGGYALPFANNVLLSAGRFILAGVTVGVSLFTVTTVSLFLTPLFKEKGPAYGLLAGCSAALMLHLAAIHFKVGKISWWPAVIKPYACVTAAVLAVWYLRYYGEFGFIAGLALLVICYLAGSMFTAGELSLFKELIPRRKGAAS
jgi:O-antigen/teichoic acid export membrane protein